MGNNISNLKVVFGADTKQYQKGATDAKKTMQDFTRTSGDYMQDFANAFGVNVGGIGRHVAAFNTGMKAMNSGMKSTAVGSGILTKALQILKVAMISTGIGALVVALGSLVSYFTKTQRGADKLAQFMAGVGAVVGELIDRASALGERIFKAFEDPKQAVAGLWEAIKTNLVNRFQAVPKLFQTSGELIAAIFNNIVNKIKLFVADIPGIGSIIDKDAVEADVEAAKGKIKNAFAELGKTQIQLVTGFDEKQQKNFVDGVKDLTKAIGDEVKASVELERLKQRLDRQEIALTKSMSERRKRIEQLVLLTRDETASDAARQKALRDAIAIEQSIERDRKIIQQGRVRYLREKQALGENLISDDRELAEAEAALNDIETESLKKRRELINRVNELNNKLEGERKQLLSRNEAAKKTISQLQEEQRQRSLTAEEMLKLSQAQNELQTTTGLLGEKQTGLIESIKQNKAQLSTLETAYIELQAAQQSDAGLTEAQKIQKQNLASQMMNLTGIINEQTASLAALRIASGEIKPAAEIQTKLSGVDTEELTTTLAPMTTIVDGYVATISGSLGNLNVEISNHKAAVAEGLNGIKTLWIDAGGTINGALESITVGFAENIGNLLAGTGQVQSFSAIVLGTMGDLAIQLGKTAIAAGIGIAGIKKALTSLNPGVAIAAGLALVALGTAIKSRLASLAEGGGGAASISGATSGSYDTRTTSPSNSATSTKNQEIKVNITGELKASGRDLKTVFDKENVRVSKTT